jgi:hypothetical protein
MRLGFTALLLASAGICACSTSPQTQVRGTPDPATAGYADVLIYAEAPDREWRESLETLLSKELSAYGITALPASALAEGSSGAGDADAVVVIAVSETGIREKWVQQQTGSGTMSSNTLVSFGGSGTGSPAGSAPAQCKTRELAGQGFAVRTPWAVIAVTVVDRATREPVWRAATEFEGQAGSDFDSLRRDYVHSLAREMAKDGLW